MKIDILADGGAYASMSPFVTWRTVVLSPLQAVLLAQAAAIAGSWSRICWVRQAPS